jgi:hypothetical protein
MMKSDLAKLVYTGWILFSFENTYPPTQNKQEIVMSV